MKDILLITPPFTQLNTPYPATAYIKGFLKTLEKEAKQVDLGLEVILDLFTKEGLSQVFESAAKRGEIQSENSQRIYALKEAYLQYIEHVVAFLQGKKPTLARAICNEQLLPQASRFAQLEDMAWAFGNMGLQDKAKHLCTLFLEDISDFIIECVDEHFGFSRYAERLGMSANSFDELYAELQGDLHFVDDFTLDRLKKHLEECQPRLICLSVPFPGNLYGAFRCGQWIKNHFPNVKIAMGGGFPNTELRSLKDARVFEFLDFICLDDGERPLERLCHFLLDLPNEPMLLKRTYHLEEGVVKYNNTSPLPDYKQAQVGTPDYSDLLLDQYISVIEIANPMHSLWSDGRWNKLTMAHGCYWGKCTFCDISLDYIKLYEPLTAKILVDRMEEITAQTGENGFHFVDEAAPPALMKEVALEILRRKLVVSWWTNIRFEKSFSADLCQLLAASGCIAVSGGLEVASDRLLELIDKGVTVPQVAQVAKHFKASGILVHAYLMYGYPTQTEQETVDSLEMVRQLFEIGVLESGFWHRFALTAHSPIGLKPEAYGIIPQLEDIQFANNDIVFEDTTGIDHDKYGYGLKKSLFNFMHGIGFDFTLSEWFDFPIPQTSIPERFIENAVNRPHSFVLNERARVLWLGSKIALGKKSKKGMRELLVHLKSHTETIAFPEAEAKWLAGFLPLLSAQEKKKTLLKDMKAEFEQGHEHFEMFWFGPAMKSLRALGLVAV